MIPTLKYVREKIEFFNERYFNGELPPILIKLTRARTRLGSFKCLTRKNPDGTREVIHRELRVSARLDLPENEIEDIIIHEMIHYYINYKGIKDSSSHGEEFKKIMNRINEMDGRNIVVSRLTTKRDLDLDTHLTLHLIILTDIPGGGMGITVCAKTKVFVIWTCISLMSKVRIRGFYGTYDPYFNRFRHSRKPDIYIAKDNKDEILEHIAKAVPLECDGRRIRTIRSKSKKPQK